MKLLWFSPFAHSGFPFGLIRCPGLTTMRPHFRQTRFFPLAEGASTLPLQKRQGEPSWGISLSAGSFSGMGIPSAEDGQDYSARGS